MMIDTILVIFRNLVLIALGMFFLSTVFFCLKRLFLFSSVFDIENTTDEEFDELEYDIEYEASVKEYDTPDLGHRKR